MMIKENYIQRIEQFIKILQENNSADLFIKKAENLEAKIRDFVIKVPLVGRFSAGKSRLLNTYLEMDILEWNDSPTTAVATELKFGLEEKFVVHYNKKTQEEKQISELKLIEKKINEIDYIEIFLNNRKLQELNEIVLVDMPGIDSNNYQHTKAVAKYIDNGHYFIAVAAPLDAFNGRLFQFIDEFANYDYDSFSFILTRKQSNHNLEDTIQKLSILLQEKYGKEIFVGATEASKLKKDINDFEKSLSIILDNKETIFMAEFEEQINALFTDSINFINNKLKGSNLSTEQLDIAITEIGKLLIKEKRNFEKNLSEIESDLTINSVSNIVNQTTSAIRSNSNQLANALKSGTINNQIENIVRPIILNGFKNAIQNTENKLSQKLDNIQKIVDTQINVVLTANTQNNSKTLSESQVMATQIVASKIAKPLAKKAISKTASIATKAGLATIGGTLGTFAGPIGTLVGVVVGELISEFFLGMAENNSIQKQINNEIIPEAIQNTENSIKEQAGEIYKNIKDIYMKMFAEFEEEKLQNINELKKEREKSEAEFNKNKQVWKETLTKIINLLKEK